MTTSPFLITLSPAKRFAFFNTDNVACQAPQFRDEAEYLVDKIKGLSLPELKRLISTSPQVADLNYQRYQNFLKNYLGELPCAFLFDGDAYQKLNFSDFSESEIQKANNSLLILSGLYGALRPLDSIQPYRLEMNTPTKKLLGYRLKDHWRSRLYPYFNDIIQENNKKFHLCLASQEYMQAIDFDKLSIPTIHFTFARARKDKYQVIGIYAKHARGMMTRYLLTNPIESLDHIKAFNEGYQFSERFSTDDNLVFIEN